MSAVSEILASQLEVPDLLTAVEVAIAHFASDARTQAVAGHETLSFVVRSLTGMRKHKYGLLVETNGMAYDNSLDDGNVSNSSMPSLNFIFFDAACRDAIFEAGGALCFSQVADKINTSTLGQGLRWETAAESASQFHERRILAVLRALKEPEDGAGPRLSLLRLCRSQGHKCYFMLPLPILQRDGETCCVRTRVALALLELRLRTHDGASITSLLDLDHKELGHQAYTKTLSSSGSCSSLSTQLGTDSEASDGDDTSSSDEEEPPCLGSLRQRCLRLPLPRYDLSGSDMDHIGYGFGRARYNALPYAEFLNVAEVSDLQSLPVRVNSMTDENGLRCCWRQRAFYRTSSKAAPAYSQTGDDNNSFGVNYIGALTAEPPSAYYGNKGLDASLAKLPAKRYYPSEHITRFDCFLDFQNLA